MFRWHKAPLSNSHAVTGFSGVPGSADALADKSFTQYYGNNLFTVCLTSSNQAFRSSSVLVTTILNILR